MKTFLLFNSPIYWKPTDDLENYLPPFGLGYIATYLEKSGTYVELIDSVKKRLGAEEIIKIIETKAPDFIGINIFTQNYDIVKFIIENINLKCIAFICGQVVKSIYNDILHWKTKVDLIAIIGEGEYIIPAIVNKTCVETPIQSVVNNKAYIVNNNSIYFPKNISDIKINREYLSDEIIINHYGEKEASIITSRGCPYNCAFCGGARSLNLDIAIRNRTEESISNEISEILSIYPEVSSIRILDDLFLKNRSSFISAYNIFGKFTNISWRGMIHTLSLLNSSDLINILCESNCRELFIGIESGSESIRKRINKLGTSSDILFVAKTILESGIDLKGYFIFGFPDETKKDFDATYNLAYKIKEISMKTKGSFRTSVFQFRPYHGTQLYNQIIQNNSHLKHNIKQNKDISIFHGRNQFNFSSGNYSCESDDLLNQYIIKTQKVMEE